MIWHYCKTRNVSDAENKFRSIYHKRRKTLWLIEQVNVEMDSLYNASGSTLRIQGI
jgi:hypothetical protein